MPSRQAKKWQIEALDTAIDRQSFQSGSAPLDRYFLQQVTQDIRRRVTACFVAYELDDAPTKKMAGYYTLASSSVLLNELPSHMGKKLPRYPTVPAVRMGRLAVDSGYKGQGLGGILLVDALQRAARSEIAAYALVVDAKDEFAVSFYEHHGFIRLPDSQMTLFLPLATVRQPI